MQYVRGLFKRRVHILEGETGRAAGEPCEAMKSASCLRAHRLDELPPFFICSWISTSSSSLNDYTHTHKHILITHTCITRLHITKHFSSIIIPDWCLGFGHFCLSVLDCLMFPQRKTGAIRINWKMTQPHKNPWGLWTHALINKQSYTTGARVSKHI